MPIQISEEQVLEEAISVFLSYSRHDLEMLRKLNKHLSGLIRTKKIKTWHDRDIEAGCEWESIIQSKLNTADIIILLISADFIDSEYCYSNELKRAIERHDAGEARVIPVILKPCLWNLGDIPFSKLSVLPDHARPISKWEDPEEAFTNVALHISKLVESFRRSKVEQQTEKGQQEVEKQQKSEEHRRQLLDSYCPKNSAEHFSKKTATESLPFRSKYWKPLSDSLTVIHGVVKMALSGFMGDQSMLGASCLKYYGSQ